MQSVYLRFKEGCLLFIGAVAKLVLLSLCTVNFPQSVAAAQTKIKGGKPILAKAYANPDGAGKGAAVSAEKNGVSIPKASDKKVKLMKGTSLPGKPRVIVTTDLGADPDDQQSMVHFLVCSNEFDIEGLIVSTGCWKKSQDSTGMLFKIINAYEKAYGNLTKHAEGYPTPEYLKSVSVLGQRKYGMNDVGSGQDSRGSDLIIAAADKDDPRPVWVQGWGGMNNLAQALWKVQKTRSAAELEKFVSKIRAYDILGQDNAGTWIAKTFPDLLYIRATYGVFGWPPSDSWLKKHVQNHGPLGKEYPNRAYSTEGDSPSFLHMYPTGLNNPEAVHQGGWGGRFARDKKTGIRGMKCMKGEDEAYDPYKMYGDAPEGQAAIKRWRSGINNNLRARMDWAVTGNYAEANHHPVAVVNGDKTRQVLKVSAKAGANVILDAAASSDPDGDSLSYNWYFYREPGTYSGKVNVQNSKSAIATVQVPSNAGGKELHMILELTDSGAPKLYAYRRVVIDVQQP